MLTLYYKCDKAIIATLITSALTCLGVSFSVAPVYELLRDRWFEARVWSDNALILWYR